VDKVCYTNSAHNLNFEKVFFNGRLGNSPVRLSRLGCVHRGGHLSFNAQIYDAKILFVRPQVYRRGR